MTFTMLYCHTSALRKHRKVVSIFWRFSFLKKQLLFAAVLNVVNKNLSLRKTFPYKCLCVCFSMIATEGPGMQWLSQRKQGFDPFKLLFMQRKVTPAEDKMCK
jgi:hypothetical protein